MVNPVAARLDIPKRLRWHPVFHTSLLRHYKENSRCKAPPIPEVIEGELEYEVESIVDHKVSKNGNQYRIRWKGYSAVDDTWEPEMNLANSASVLKSYKRAHKIK